MNPPSWKLYNERNTRPLITIYDSGVDRSLNYWNRRWPKNEGEERPRKRKTTEQRRITAAIDFAIEQHRLKQGRPLRIIMSNQLVMLDSNERPRLKGAPIF